MRFLLPSDKDLANVMVSGLHPRHLREPSYCLDDFIKEIESSIKVAKLNQQTNREYIAYLKYLAKYIKVSNSGDTSTLKRELEDIFRVRKLHMML